MPIIERTIYIEAAPEAVTAVTENAYRFPEWFTGVEDVDVVGDWPAVSTYTLDYTLADSAEGQEMGWLISERANEISIGQSLGKLKALVEG
jgi:carbon monoxide dehydrogenase subunit G